MDDIIRAENLYFSYDDNKSYSLNNFSVNIKAGKKIAFMGANGAGKSTFFLALNGINRISSGNLYIDGEKLSYEKKKLLSIREKIGIVFQDPDNQLFSASVKQEISFGALNMGMSEIEAKNEVEKIIDRLEIESFKEKPTHSLSGGQKKQVSIADVLVMRPKIVILDEPFSALDPKHIGLVKKAIDMMVENNITVIISTHDVDFAYEWAEEIVLVHQGQVLRHTSTEEAFFDTESLEKTNLEMPKVLEMFLSLVKKGILAEGLKIPRNIKELENHILNT